MSRSTAPTNRPPEPLLVAQPELRHTGPSAASAGWQKAKGDSTHQIQFLAQEVQQRGERLPLMLQSYLSLGTGVWLGETSRDADFGDALKLGIVVPLAHMDARPRKRFGLGRRSDSFVRLPSP